MKLRERLLECKIKLRISRDYALAKALKINSARICDDMAGRRIPDTYTTIKMAEILKVHPLLLVAEFEGDMEKDEEKKTFWLTFAQRIKTGAIAILALICIVIWSPVQEATLGELDARNA